MADRFHRAARDGYLDLLKEGTKRDMNAHDEDGMTPTLWAAHEGRLDALRLICGRGGDPDKCDHYGNTALHCSAARGHMNCVSFLSNFGVNLWALDNDYHTAKDLAAINSKDEILKYLDGVITETERKNKKLARSMKEKAMKDADKRVKEFEKIKKKMDRRKEKEGKRIEREIQKMSTDQSEKEEARGDGIVDPRQKSHFSDLVSNKSSVSSKKSLMGGVSKKLLKKKNSNSTISSAGGTINGDTSSFKVRELHDDGAKSVRSLQGLRRDNQILYVHKFDGNGKRGRLSDVFETDCGSLEGMRAVSEPDFLARDDNALMYDPPSIFSRPGFGNMAFRTSVAANFHDLTERNEEEEDEGSGEDKDREPPWDEEDLPSDDDDEEDDFATSPLQLFLAAHSLSEYTLHLARERIDLDALMLLNEAELTSLGLPLGPRKKLLKAIQERKETLENPGEVMDSHL